MEVLLKEDWSFVFYKDHEEKFTVEVVCGSVAIFEVNYQLSPEDVETFNKEGDGFIKRLVKDIQKDPSRYQKAKN